MKLNVNDYRNKVLGCWMGKNIGGTLGMPFEWKRQVNDVTFYTQELTGNLPNDDLDIQLLWLVAMEEQGVAISTSTLAEYWMAFVTPHWAEYGNAKLNMRAGLLPPLSGDINNVFRDSCGAFIRSEIWACIAPGNPSLAARYALEDAMIDHGSGEGTYAEVFCAAVESAAFVEDDIYKLVDIGFQYIPEDCAVAGAARCAIESYRSGKTWLEARNAILEGYRGSAYFNQLESVSPDDQARGFVTGKLGFDVPSNIGIFIAGLLYGGGDFDKTMSITVNCGEDTDCTAATAGSLFGIMHGAGAISPKWLEPIGRNITTGCLNIGELGNMGSQLPQNLDELTDRTERLARQVLLRFPYGVELTDEATSGSFGKAALLPNRDFQRAVGYCDGTTFRADFLEATVQYPDGAFIRAGQPVRVKLSLYNTHRIQTVVNVRWYTPEGWVVTPAAEGTLYVAWSEVLGAKTTEFTVIAPAVKAGVNRAVIEVTIDGKPTVILVPVMLFNGALE